MATIIGFPANRDNSGETEIKVGSYQPSTVDIIIKRGQAVLSRLECNLTWEAEWRDLILALGAGRDLALRSAETTKPQGRKYRTAIGAWLRCYGFDCIDRGDRSRLIECFDHLDEINAWRSALPVAKQAKLNHPRTVLAHWKRSLQPTQSDDEQGAKSLGPPAGGPHHRRPPIAVDTVLTWLVTANPEDKRRIMAALGIDIGADVVKRAVAQEKRRGEKHAQHLRNFKEDVRSAITTAEPVRHQIDRIKNLIETSDSALARTTDWCDRMDLPSSRSRIVEPKQSTSPVPTVLAHPPTKH